jgi:hypothetical protein
VKPGAVAVTALLLFAAGGAAQAASPSEHAISEGRYHLRKANALAGDDRCQAAIHEYTLAFKKLGDPVVLFNRAECYRRIGEDEKAVADYRTFLEAVPAAPNRAEIEAKIGTLTTALTATSVNPSPVAGAASVHPTSRGPERPTAPPPVRPSATASPYLSAERPPLIEDAPAPAPAAPPPAVTLVQAPPVASASSEGEGHHGKTWIWVAVGAAVAGGAVGAYFALRTPATVPPSTELGNYKF